MTIQEQFTGLETHLETLRRFVATYGDKIPEGLGGADVTDREAFFSVHLGYQPERERLRGLQAIGDIFGRDGWKATPCTDGRSWDWKREIDGVKVTIFAAETLPKLEPMPVPPSKFPIQIESV